MGEDIEAVEEEGGENSGPNPGRRRVRNLFALHREILSVGGVELRWVGNRASPGY